MAFLFAGGTSEEIRKMLPQIAGDLAPSPSNPKEEVFVIVICGLNDWKSILLNFPFGSGPVTFKANLDVLLAEIKELTGGKCKIFLPALPMNCAEYDSNSRSVFS